MSKERKIVQAIGIVSAISGVLIIWKLDGVYDALGVFLMIYSHNIDKHLPDSL